MANTILNAICGLLAGIRDLWHIVLVKLCWPPVFRNGPLFVRANGISHFPEPTDDPAQLRRAKQEPSTTEYRNQLTNGVYRQDTEMGNIQMSFTIGQYDYETKAAFMGGTGSETSWKRARGVTRIEKCMIALTEDNQYCVFPKASVIARNTNNEGAVGIGVAAAALEPDNTAVSSEYWFDSSEVDVE